MVVGADDEPSVQASLPFDGLLAEALRDAAEATRLEAKASATGAPEVVHLRNGHPVGSAGHDRLWSFEVSTHIALHADTPAKLEGPELDPLPATVLAVGDSSVIVGLREELGGEVPSAQLSIEAGFILQRLADRLEESSAGGAADPTVLEALLLPDLDDAETGGLVPAEVPSPEDDQTRAAERAVEAGLRFTWGPPGTGKTRVLADAVDLASVRDQRVLVLAHSNAAVDVAIGRIADKFRDTEELDEGRVLRVGTPHAGDILQRAEVLPEAIAAKSQPGLSERRSHLVTKRRALADEARSTRSSAEHRDLSDRLRTVRAELVEIDRGLADSAAALIDGAAVIATTLSRAVINEQIWRWPADVVIVDEASMAGLPFLVALASRGPRTLSCFGDFRQLPPICISDSDAARHWFARDVFDAAEVISAWEAGLPDDRLSILRTQFRMGEQICETVNKFAYDGLLRTHSLAARNGIRLAEAPPVPGGEVVIVDTSDLATTCYRDPAPDAFSRSNPLSAAISLTIADALAESTGTEVAIISPYRLQVRLLEAAVRDRPLVTAATTHRFQGAERDAVVFDLVDAGPADGASSLTGTNVDTSQRLLNVAASRARGKLVLVVDRTFVENAHPLNSPTRRFIDCAVESGAEELSALDLIGEETQRNATDRASRSLTWVPGWADAVRLLAGRANGSMPVEINLPSEDAAGPQVAQLLDTTAGASVVLRAPAQVARGLEPDDQTSVKLATKGPAPWITAGSDLAVGSADPAAPAAVFTNAFSAARFRDAVLGES